MNDVTPERWLPVVGWEGLYEVSSEGRVYSVAHMTSSGMRGGQMLKPHVGNGGRWEVKLWKNNAGKTRRIHQLVAGAFIGPCPPGMECRHLDDVQSNNRLSNLAYGTSHDNKVDMLRNGGAYWANQTHCVNGHEFTEENTHWRKDRPGSRGCKACHNEGSAQRRREQVASGPRCINGCDSGAIALGLCVKCYERKRKGDSRPADWASRTCKHCGKPFQMPFGQGARKYCSDDCARKAKSAREVERQRQKRRETA